MNERKTVTMSQRTRRTQLLQHLQAELVESEEAEAITDRLIETLVAFVVGRLPWWVPFKGKIGDKAREALDAFFPEGFLALLSSAFNGGGEGGGGA